MSSDGSALRRRKVTGSQPAILNRLLIRAMHTVNHGQNISVRFAVATKG